MVYVPGAYTEVLARIGRARQNLSPDLEAFGKSALTTPEDKARETIDQLLTSSGWEVQDRKNANLDAARGVAIREFSLGQGYGEADYLLFADGQAVGVVEAKREGSTLTGVEIQTQKYSEGIPAAIPAPRRPLPFCYQSTGIEARFTNFLEPQASSRSVFSFHQPETLSRWLGDELSVPGSTPKAKLEFMPVLLEDGLRPAQIIAVCALEESLRHGRRRALIQMATGAVKTYTACSLLYRLIKFAGFKRVLFLVDRGNLGRQALKEFQAFRTPDDGRLFTELYNVQHLQSNRVDPVAKVCISTIQRLFSMLKGEDLDLTQEELSGSSLEMLQRPPEPIGFNPALPIETFDLIVTDECHRSIYNQWRQVLEYFDASLIGLTATPSRQTMGFFNQNLVMEYPYEQAVADGFPVPVIFKWVQGKPNFREIDVHKWRSAVQNKTCMICGNELNYWSWYVGGDACLKSKLMINGAMHRECAEESMRLCPFLNKTRTTYRGELPTHPNQETKSGRPDVMHLMRGRTDAMKMVVTQNGHQLISTGSKLESEVEF